MVVIISCMTEYSSEQCQISSYFVLKYCFFFLLIILFYCTLILIILPSTIGFMAWKYGPEIRMLNDANNVPTVPVLVHPGHEILIFS